MTREINAGERTGRRQEWRTARPLAALIATRFEIDLDAMARWHNAIVPRYIADPLETDAPNADLVAAVNALEVKWATFGKRIFVNPPFALMARVVFKMIEAAKEGAHVVMLAPDNGDTRWYASLVDEGASVMRFRGRPKFEPADAPADAPAIKSTSPGFPSALYVLRDFPERRKAHAPVPTYAVDPRTLETL